MANNEITEEEKLKIKSMIDDLVEKAKKASEEYLKLNQEQVDNIIKAMSMAGLEHHMELAKMAIEETGRGIYEDKITKNMFSTEYVYHSIKNDKTVGVISENASGFTTKIGVTVSYCCLILSTSNSISKSPFLTFCPSLTFGV